MKAICVLLFLASVVAVFQISMAYKIGYDDDENENRKYNIPTGNDYEDSASNETKRAIGDGDDDNDDDDDDFEMLMKRRHYGISGNKNDDGDNDDDNSAEAKRASDDDDDRDDGFQSKMKQQNDDNDAATAKRAVVVDGDDSSSDESDDNSFERKRADVRKGAPNKKGPVVVVAVGSNGKPIAVIRTTKKPAVNKKIDAVGAAKKVATTKKSVTKKIVVGAARIVLPVKTTTKKAVPAVGAAKQAKTATKKSAPAVGAARQAKAATKKSAPAVGAARQAKAATKKSVPAVGAAQKAKATTKKSAPAVGAPKQAKAAAKPVNNISKHTLVGEAKQVINKLIPQTIKVGAAAVKSTTKPKSVAVKVGAGQAKTLLPGKATRTTPKKGATAVVGAKQVTGKLPAGVTAKVAATPVQHLKSTPKSSILAAGTTKKPVVGAQEDAQTVSPGKISTKVRRVTGRTGRFRSTTPLHVRVAGAAAVAEEKEKATPPSVKVVADVVKEKEEKPAVKVNNDESEAKSAKVKDAGGKDKAGNSNSTAIISVVVSKNSTDGLQAGEPMLLRVTNLNDTNRPPTAAAAAAAGTMMVIVNDSKKEQEKQVLVNLTSFSVVLPNKPNQQGASGTANIAAKAPRPAVHVVINSSLPGQPGGEDDDGDDGRNPIVGDMSHRPAAAKKPAQIVSNPTNQPSRSSSQQEENKPLQNAASVTNTAASDKVLPPGVFATSVAPALKQRFATTALPSKAKTRVTVRSKAVPLMPKGVANNNAAVVTDIAKQIINQPQQLDSDIGDQLRNHGYFLKVMPNGGLYIHHCPKAAAAAVAAKTTEDEVAQVTDADKDTEGSSDKDDDDDDNVATTPASA